MSIKHNSRWPVSNHNNAAEYQLSSLPYVLNGFAPAHDEANVDDRYVKISFDNVTRWIVIHNKNQGNHSIRIGFSRDGILSNNYFVVHAGEQTPRLELRCKEIFLSSGVQGNTTEYTVLAGMTNINSANFPELQGEGV
tara:strand:- start:2923 stop:3336 length:414 start_codon:yes stop_codon:yes gene_type:complete